ncbi:hypothetical protein FQR65_LT21013 [Abscondita terminalis]|nr:hypothetical protein FQR65_LT21013 [Abscondita terminalis]
MGAGSVRQDGPDIDAELIVLTWRLWGELGIRDAVKLELNSLGTSAARARYRDGAGGVSGCAARPVGRRQPASAAPTPGCSTARTGDPGRVGGRAGPAGGYLDENPDPLRGAQGAPASRWRSYYDHPQAGAWPWITTARPFSNGSRPARARMGQTDLGRGFRHGGRALGLMLEPGQVPPAISRQIDVYLCAFGEAAELAA